VVLSSQPDCVWALGAELGEGPVWSAGEEAIWFVDIKKKQIHRFGARSGAKRSWDAPAAPGFLAPMGGGKFIAGLKTGLHAFDPATGAFEFLSNAEADRPANRLNDGAVDRHGRLWFGSMDDGESAPNGKLYCYDRGAVRAMDDGYVITNGPAFSPDGRTLYHTDTLEKTIYAFDIADDGSLAGKRVFVAIEDGAGYPDGLTIDAEGCLWTGLFAGWAVRRYSQSGKLLTTIRFPCANVTKIAFGGSDLREVYATTAWKGLSAQDRAAQPLAGGLFRFEADVPGLPQNEVRNG
jgi:sugar lactone lactonase YvrE